MFHSFKPSICLSELPYYFTNPFQYEPHSLCKIAASEMQHYLDSLHLNEGKMYGILVVAKPSGELGYLMAFSGLLNGTNHHCNFVPPIYDLLDKKGYFKEEENRISLLNKQIEALEQSNEYIAAINLLENLNKEFSDFKIVSKESLKLAKIERDKKRALSITEEQKNELIRESQFQKAQIKREELRYKEKIELAYHKKAEQTNRIDALKKERKQRSGNLQNWLFDQFKLRNSKGEIKTILNIFETYSPNKVPPAGTGECAAPKLLQYAYNNHLRPIAMVEFWWGQSPTNEIRKHGYYYPACNEKCKPLLTFMLQGLPLEEISRSDKLTEPIDFDIKYEDNDMVVINKPSGILSVPGKNNLFSVYQWAVNKYPLATGPLIVHRLDMDTSGLLVIAKNKEVHKNLQQQFLKRDVFKKYIALLNGVLEKTEGKIDLPLCCDPNDRPRQMVNYQYGKKALTHYKVIETSNGKTRVELTPLTGRTHQLRVHAAHHEGLNIPIVGDPLYGKKEKRLYLHAQKLSFVHPTTGKRLELIVEPEF